MQRRGDGRGVARRAGAGALEIFCYGTIPSGNIVFVFYRFHLLSFFFVWAGRRRRLFCTLLISLCVSLFPLLFRRAGSFGAFKYSIRTIWLRFLLINVCFGGQTQRSRAIFVFYLFVSTQTHTHLFDSAASLSLANRAANSSPGKIAVSDGKTADNFQKNS